MVPCLLLPSIPETRRMAGLPTGQIVAVSSGHHVPKVFRNIQWYEVGHPYNLFFCLTLWTHDNVLSGSHTMCKCCSKVICSNCPLFCFWSQSFSVLKYLFRSITSEWYSHCNFCFFSTVQYFPTIHNSRNKKQKARAELTCRCWLVAEYLGPIFQHCSIRW